MEFVLRVTEWVLGRPIRSVLDVGCGEGQWQPQLARLRPAMHYDGVDPSAYAVARFGRQRGLQLGGIEDLDTLALREQYDLVVCCGMLNYLPLPTLRRGLAHLSLRTGGVAYLELFSNTDALEGDTSWPPPQSAAWYRRMIRRAGFHPIGMHAYVKTAQRARVSTLERL